MRKIQQFYCLLFLSISIFCIGISSKAQIQFYKETYFIGENVKVGGTELVIGVENGLKNAIDEFDFGTHTIDLGVSKKAGLYMVTFIQIDKSRHSYLIALNDYDVEIENSIIELGDQYMPEPEEKNLFLQVHNFFRDKNLDERYKPFLKALETFTNENQISIVKNVTFCISAGAAEGSVPILNTLCKDLTIDNLKDLSLEVLKEIFKEMYEEGYLTQEQYNELKIDFFTKLVKVLKNDCATFFDIAADKIDNEGLKLLLKYDGQICGSTIAIIKEYKKLP